MSTTEIVRGVEFDSDDGVVFTKPKVNNSGGKNIGILNASTKKSLYMSTPLMLTWGVNEYKDDNTGRVSYDMSLQFPNDEYNTEELSQFLKNLQAFESRIKQDAITNCKEWMNKPKMSAEVIEALWTPMLRYPKDKNSGEYDYSRAPTLRIKIPYWESEFKNVEIYNTNHELLFPLANDTEQAIGDYIVKGSNVATIIQCGGIWFANGKFGVTWKLFQCLVKPKQTLSGKCHITLTSNEREKMVVDSDVEDDVDNVEDNVEDTVKSGLTEPSESAVPAPPTSPVKELQIDDMVKSKKKVVKKVKKAVTAEAVEE